MNNIPPLKLDELLYYKTNNQVATSSLSSNNLQPLSYPHQTHIGEHVV